MTRFSIIIAMIILVASLVLLVDKLFTPQPIQIELQSGQVVTTQTADYFSLSETIILMSCSFLIGAASLFLFYNSERSVVGKSEKEGKVPLDTILPLVREEEKKVLIALREANGEMLQNKLVLKMSLSKVKMTRMLASLERKRLIIKERRGLTNNIKLTL